MSSFNQWHIALGITKADTETLRLAVDNVNWQSSDQGMRNNPTQFSRPLVHNQWYR
jgi:hypothetical protein